MKLSAAVFLASAPLLARAAPWSDSCTGLSELAFIVIVVESIVLVLFFGLSLCLCTKVQHQKRRIHGRNAVVQPTVSHHTGPVADDDLEQSAELLAPRIPGTLRPRSVLASSRSTLVSSALYAYPPKSADAHEADTPPAPAQPALLESSTALPNPHSQGDHAQGDAARSPSPSIYPSSLPPARSGSVRSTRSWIDDTLGFDSVSAAPGATAHAGLHSPPTSHHPHVVMPAPQTYRPELPQLMADDSDKDDLESYSLLDAHARYGET